MDGRRPRRSDDSPRNVKVVLDAAGIDVPDKIRAEITGCNDLDRLDTRIRRAGTAKKVHDLFD